MLRSMKDLEDYSIGATDGNIGQVTDFLFDDHAWVIRYLVVDTGSWLSSRKVLISPISIHDPNWGLRTLPVSITKEQVRNSPDIDTDKPISRQHEIQYHSYYGYPYYGGGVGIWGAGMYPYMMDPGYPGYSGFGLDRAEREKDREAFEKVERARHRNDDPTLRSCKEVMGYHTHATDGEIGHVQGLLVDDATWAVRYLVVNTSNWGLGRLVLIAPQWIKDIEWSNGSLTVDLTRASVKDSPPYDPTAELDREQESSLHNYYRRPGYWGPTT